MCVGRGWAGVVPHFTALALPNCKKGKLCLSSVCLDFLYCSCVHLFTFIFPPLTFRTLAGHRCFGAAGAGAGLAERTQVHACAHMNTHNDTQLQQ